MTEDEWERLELDRILVQFQGGRIYKHEAIDAILALRKEPDPLPRVCYDYMACSSG